MLFIPKVMKTILATNNPAKEAGHLLGEILTMHKHVPVLLLVSGGSAFALLEHVPPEVCGSHLTLAVLDERFSTDATITNFAQLSQTDFFARATGAGAVSISSLVLPAESLASHARRFETALQKWRDDNATGVVVATLGMGVDGHTAGIFPGYVEELDRRGRWVEGYEVPLEINDYTKRITVTPRFLSTQINAAVAFVAGPQKRALLGKVMAAETTSEYPAALWKTIPVLRIVTDHC